MSDEREEKETYHKEDRRPGRIPDPEPEAEVSEDPAEPSPETPEEPAIREPDFSAEAPDEPQAPETAADVQIDVYGLMRMMLGMFVEQAWVQMGVQLAPGAKDLKTDLKQARIAIDTVKFMNDALGDTLDPAEKREVESLLATLRMNYLQRS